MIHRVRIQHFKSIADVSVDLSPATVLVGRSGTGKSNFVPSPRFLRDVLISPQNLQQHWPREHETWLIAGISRLAGKRLAGPRRIHSIAGLRVAQRRDSSGVFALA